MTSRTATAALTIGAEVIAQLKGVVTIPLLTRLLPPADYAAFAQSLALVGLLLPTITLATEAAVLRYLPGADVSRQRSRFTAWCIALAAAATMASLLVVAAAAPLGRIMIGEDARGSAFVAASCLLIWSGLVQQAIRIWFRATGQLRMFSLATVAQSLVGMAAIIAATWAGLDGVSLVAAVACADLLACLAALPQLARDRPFARPDFSETARFLAYAVPTLPAAYTAWCVTFVDRLVVVHLVGLEEAGYVALSAGLAYALVRLYGTPLFLQYSHEATLAANRGDTAGLSRIFRQATLALLILSVPLVAGGWLVAGDLVAVMAAPSYLPAAALLPLFLAAFALQLSSSVNELLLQLSSRALTPLVSALLVLATMIAMNLLLVPRLSFVGAAAATLAGYLAAWAYTAWQVRDLLSGLAGLLLRVLLATTLMVGACLLVQASTGANGLAGLLGVAGVGVVVYGCAAMLPKLGFAHDACVADLVAGWRPRRSNRAT